MVLFCPFSGLGKFHVADVGSRHAVTDGSKSDRLRSDPAGAVQNMGGSVKSVGGKDPVQKESLLLRGGLSIEEQLVIVGSQVIVKNLRNTHAANSFG